MDQGSESVMKQISVGFNHGYVRPDGKFVVQLRPSKPKYRALLSIDGGGVRGIIPAVIWGGFEKVVKEVVRELHPKELEGVPDDQLVVDVKDYFDMVAGNSAGSILALYLATGGGRKELYEKGGIMEGMEPGSASAGIAMVDDFVKQVFKPRWHTFIPGMKWLSGFIWSKYKQKGLVKALQNLFGDQLMSNLKCNTFVPAFELENARPVGFYASEVHGPSAPATTVPGYIYPCDDQPHLRRKSLNVTYHGVPVPYHFESVDADVPVRVVAQASSSAPVYFPPVEYSSPGLGGLLGLKSDKVSWADGGLVSNNPTIQALGFMASLFSDKDTKRMLRSSKMAVLSLGTGARKEQIYIGGGKGLVPWANDLVPALMEAHTWVHHQIVDALFDGGLLGRVDETSDRYIRINRVAAKGSPDFDIIQSLDSFDKLESLKGIGQDLITESHDRIEEFVKNILMASEI